MTAHYTNLSSLVMAWHIGFAGATDELTLSGSTMSYSGQSDASALVALDDHHFAVGDDENNVVHVYPLSGGNKPVFTLDLSAFLQVRKPSIEADIEGAARIGDRIYWITSHGRNASGQSAPNRHRFFATDIVLARGVPPQLKPVGIPSRDLLQQLCANPLLQPYQLQRAAGLAPKSKGALNIEGLTPTPEGGLLLGFRNPLIGGKALVVPLLNPAEVIEGKPATIGKPVLLDLNGQGIRSMDLWNRQYFIVGGAFAEGGQSALYSWNGLNASARIMYMPHFIGMNPESITVMPLHGNPALLSVSDDGNKLVNGVPQKKIRNPFLRNFRVGLVRLEPLSSAPFDLGQQEYESK